MSENNRERNYTLNDDVMHTKISSKFAGFEENEYSRITAMAENDRHERDRR